MREIRTPHAPQPAGHYSQAFAHNEVVYVSGQLPIDPQTGEKCLGPVEEQTRVVLRNLSKILEAANSSLKQVLTVTLYIADIRLWDRVDKVYAESFTSHRPARVVVPTPELHFGFQIEVAAIAACAEAA